MDLLNIRMPRFKLVEEPLIPILGRSVDAANFFAMFALLTIAVILALKLKGRIRQFARRTVQLSAMVITFFVFAQMWCGFRNEILGLMKIGIDNYYSFAFMYLWLLIIAFSLVVGRFFCGWICPVGFIQELLGKRIFGKMQDNITFLNTKIFRALLLVIFTALILWLTNITSPATFALIDDACILYTIGLFILIGMVLYNDINDKNLRYFKYPSAIMTIVLALIGMRVTGPACSIYMNELDYSSTIATMGIFLGAFVLPHAYCRYICPFGAFFKLTAFLPFLRIKRDNKKCISCGACTAVCAVGAAEKTKINVSECQLCTACIDTCKHNGVRIEKVEKK